MATNLSKKKSGKDSTKSSSKRSEETPSVGDRKDETPLELEDPSESPQETVIETPQPREPTPEPVYEEPVLTQLVVESYEGEKAKGLYEGHGEALFHGGHHYKGQFAEGLMHGRGIYTWADGVVYEGEFTQNQVTGKGVYRWPDNSNYEGEVVNGMRHGYGIYRCPNNKLSYTGEWCMGKRHGKGRMDYDNNGVSFYDGDWVESTRHGLGTRCYPSGNMYQGMWFNNIRHGDGTMRWMDRDQMYTGQWENGIQHGMGQHIWFLRRMAGSQYPLRNMYDGDFVKGLRQGIGTFYFANGARYEGNWQSNKKHGRGKFIFKNGRVYEGVFDKDHIVEFPNFEMDGVTTPDMANIRTRTPLPSEGMSMHSNDSRNTYSPSFQLDVDHLLEEFPEADREEEAAQVIFVIMRYITSLRKIYNLYSGLGYEESLDNTFVMNRMQFWRFLKDCRLHHHELTLTQMDRLLAASHKDSNSLDVHNPYTKILFREFTNSLVTLAFHLYQEGHTGTGPMLGWCLSKLVTENVLKYSCTVKGYMYTETRRAINALVHMDQAYEVYKAFCSPSKGGGDMSLKMRQFLYMNSDLKLINDDLKATAVVDIIAEDDPNVRPEGAINLELEMTFLEFFEALVGSAQVYVTEAVVKDPTTPRPSTTLTRDHSLLSVPNSPSRGPSQSGVGDGDDVDTDAGSPDADGVSEGGSPQPPRSASVMTAKTGEGSIKPEMSHTTAASNSDAAGLAISRHTQPDSAKKSELSAVDLKKSASFISNHSAGTDGHMPFMQSVVSIGGVQSEAHDDMRDGDDEVEEELVQEDAEEELDEATRQFNFWTHQVHIFFVRKFFPAAQKLIFLRQVVRARPPAPEPEAPDTGTRDTGFNDSPSGVTDGTVTGHHTEASLAGDMAGD